MHHEAVPLSHLPHNTASSRYLLLRPPPHQTDDALPRPPTHPTASKYIYLIVTFPPGRSTAGSTRPGSASCMGTSEATRTRSPPGCLLAAPGRSRTNVAMTASDSATSTRVGVEPRTFARRAGLPSLPATLTRGTAAAPSLLTSSTSGMWWVSPSSPLRPRPVHIVYGAQPQKVTKGVARLSRLHS